MRLIVVVLLGLASAVSAQQFRFHPVDDEKLKARLSLLKQSNKDRMEALSGLFEEAGCTGERLQRQQVKGHKIPNVVCTLPGETAATVVVGAHFDHVAIGQGAVDNWSGASLLPSLFEGLAKTPTQITFVFVGFTEEEAGLNGSKFFIKQWKKDKRPPIQAMVNLDTLGLSPTKVEVEWSDKRLLNVFVRVAEAMKLPVTGMNVGQVGMTDGREFSEAKIPVVDIHSVTQDTLRILHSPFDELKSVNFDYYRDTYRLTAGFLAYLDALQVQAVRGAGTAK